MCVVPTAAPGQLVAALSASPWCKALLAPIGANGCQSWVDSPHPRTIPCWPLNAVGGKQAAGAGEGGSHDSPEGEVSGSSVVFCEWTYTRCLPGRATAAFPVLHPPISLMWCTPPEHRLIPRQPARRPEPELLSAMRRRRSCSGSRAGRRGWRRSCRSVAQGQGQCISVAVRGLCLRRKAASALIISQGSAPCGIGRWLEGWAPSGHNKREVVLPLCSRLVRVVKLPTCTCRR